MTDAVRTQILATEHWSLLATRSMTWNEIFSRATMFMTVLSAAVVGIALVAQATDFGPGARVFALLVLPVVLLVGVMTFVRLGEANSHDIMLVIGMNRLRHAYLELAPELEPYFVTAHHDDHAAILQTYGAGYRYSVGRVLGGTPALVAIINVVLAGVVAALVAAGLGATEAVVIAAGLAGAAGGGCRPGGARRPRHGPGSGRLPPALSDPVGRQRRACEARAGVIGLALPRPERQHAETSAPGRDDDGDEQELHQPIACM